MDIVEGIIKAKKLAINNGIKANTVILDEHFAKINGFDLGLKIGDTGEIISVPTMIAGLKVDYEKFDPELNINFVVCEKREEESKEQKILNLLRDKRVDLWLVSTFVDKFSTLDTFVEYYNYINGWKGYQLTSEEMQLILEWLKEE